MSCPVPEVKKKISNKSFLRRVSCVVAPLGVLAFWGGMLMAARRYPSEYDWRYMTVSSLFSPGRDPGGYLWASGGAVLGGLFGLCWAAVLAQRNHEGAGDRPGGIWALRLGHFCMVCSAVLPQWLLRVPKGHEILALVAFVGLCLGMVHLTFQAVERSFLRRTRRSVARSRLYAAVMAGSAVFPILMAALAQAYVFYALPELPWVSLAWRARGVPVYFSFAFWEWLTCLVLSAYMVILALTTHSHGSWRLDDPRDNSTTCATGC